MADTMGTPAKGIKKKKAFAFLKSGPKSSPSSDADGGQSGGGKSGNEAGEDDDGLDLFRRSRDFFPIVVQEQVRPQVSPDEVEDHDRLSQASTQSPSPPSSKRRKLSSPMRTTDFKDTEDDLYGPPTPPRRSTKSISTSPQKPRTMRSTPSPAQSKGKGSVQPVQGDILLTPTRSSSNQPCANEVISLVDEEDDAFEKLPPSRRATSAATTSTRTIRDASVTRDEETPSFVSITIDDDDDDLFENSSNTADKDDPFAHFVVRAREREDAAKAEAAAAAASRAECQPATPDGAPKREPMIEVEIFVQSRMARFPDVGPFGAKRGMSQNLGVIRRFFIMWLQKGGHAISEEDEANTFLTWKRRKIYDVSTGVSLGWKLPAAENSRSSSTPGFMKGGVLLEAWTQEDYDRWLAEEEKQRMVKRGDLVEDVSDEEFAEEPDERDTKIRISIKEKDQEPFKLTVYADMQIRLLIPAIRKMRKIPNDREIKLRFEGEWLEGDGTVEEADIEDLCTVEMYLR
ncbi:hypothetical protein KVR01_003480 [Diaporthe batatas]|uniref:uncharacterized protein n=1 Tax=Diaporthe batatas TaxID=748121 RepID=UPI001D03C905|nr:uncharacterized protein KVR01_003480 [Diaporthe batatas]KAG8167791.1 hypothetical protein KVR01_003480 [Diaporthe batatas]